MMAAYRGRSEPILADDGFCLLLFLLFLLGDSIMDEIGLKLGKNWRSRQSVGKMKVEARRSTGGGMTTWRWPDGGRASWRLPTSNQWAAVQGRHRRESRAEQAVVERGAEQAAVQGAANQEVAVPCESG
jgi:hypothetical protein